MQEVIHNFSKIILAYYFKMRAIVILFLLVGICLVVVGYVQSNQSCPPPVVEFKYIPRTFEDDQILPRPLMSIFGQMFEGDDAWQQTQGFADKVFSRQLAATDDSQEGAGPIVAK